ncbi:MAG: amino acid permease [Planctomycetes bacterium]|nr:amino acid permease [Planctomycetota bacterium]
MADAGARGTGVLGAAAIGIGGMVGGGIFAVLGTAVGLAGGGTPVAFLVAGVVALLTSYAYAKLAVRFPSAGGTTVFLDRAFGVDYLTGVLNLVLWLGYLVTTALYAAAFGAYAETFLDGPSPVARHVLASAAIALPALLNALDAASIARVETGVVVLKLTLLLLVVAAGAPHVDPARLAPSAWAAPSSLVVGGMVIFVAYEGFELIANAAEDVRDPARTLPRAFYGSVLFVIALYVLVAIVTVGSVSEATIAAAKDYALAEAARPALGHVGFVLVAVSALLATLSAINATLYGNARLGFGLAKDGELPALLERGGVKRPLAGVAVSAGLSLLLVNLVELEAIAILGSAGFLLVFTAVNAAAFRLSAECGARRWVTGTATLASLAALVALTVHTALESPAALGVLGGMLGAAALFELVYPRLSGRTFAGLRARALR